MKDKIRKIFEIKKLDEIPEELLEKFRQLSGNKLFITEDLLKQHLTENEILDLLSKNILKDKTLE